MRHPISHIPRLRGGDKGGYTKTVRTIANSIPVKIPETLCMNLVRWQKLRIYLPDLLNSAEVPDRAQAPAECLSEILPDARFQSRRTSARPLLPADLR